MSRPCTRDSYSLRMRVMKRRISLIASAAIVIFGFFGLLKAETPLTELTYSLDKRMEICREILHKMSLWYSYSDEKNIDWESIRQRYLTQAVEATSDYEFIAGMSAMVRELHDGHSYMYDYPKSVSVNRGRPCVRIIEAEGKPIVAKVVSGSDADTKGVVPGLEIVSVNGQPAEERIRSLIPLVHSSTPWHARGVAIAAMLNGNLNEAVRVEFMNQDGKAFSLELACEDFVREIAAITAEVLCGNIGLLTLPSFSASNLGLESGDALVKEFDAALERLKETKALIIDVRGNGGGDDKVAGSCAGRFFTSKVEFPGFRMRMVTLGRPWFTPRIRRSVSPRGKWQYTQPVVLLVDESVMSSAEHFVAGMHDSGRSTTIGHNTAGSSGNPIRLEVSGFKFQVSRWQEYRSGGTLIEGHGVPADIAVGPTINDIADGIDTVLMLAMGYLNSR